MADYWSNFRNR